jgi:hypothetical protein
MNSNDIEQGLRRALDELTSKTPLTNPLHPRVVALQEGAGPSTPSPARGRAYETKQVEQVTTTRKRPPWADVKVLTLAACVVAVLAVVLTVGVLHQKTKSLHPATSVPTSTTSTPHGTVLVSGVVGENRTAAIATLKAAGLVVKMVVLAPSTRYATGLVIAQNPPAGTALAKGSSVTLTVSSGPTGSIVGPASTTVPPNSSTSTTAVPVVNPLTNGVYVNGTQSVPHYYLSLSSVAAGALTGTVGFVYQDGQSSVVFTFDGSSHNGVATLRPTSIPQGAGSASQDPSTVPSAISATYDQGAVNLGECTSYLHFAQSLAQCSFTYSPQGP